MKKTRSVAKDKVKSLFSKEDTVEYDIVHKAKHYNRHPSGYEPKEICRLLPFNLGNVFKYVWRHEDKEPLRSLQSAKWYWDDHLKYADVAPRWKLHDDPQTMRKYDLMVRLEPNPQIKDFLQMFWHYLNTRHDDFKNAVTGSILQLIAVEERKTQNVCLGSGDIIPNGGDADWSVTLPPKPEAAVDPSY